MSTNCNTAPLTVYGASQTWGVNEMIYIKEGTSGISAEDAKTFAENRDTLLKRTISL